MKNRTKRDRLHEDEPQICVVLRLDDLHHAQRARRHDEAHERHGHRDFVADELRRRAQAGQQRELAVRRPPSEDDAVDADRGHRHDVEQPDVDVGDVERNFAAEEIDARPERDDGERDERRHHHDNRRGRENPLVGARRGDVFLEDQLDRVGNRLKSAVRADAHRSEAHLHPGDDLALEEDHVGHADERRIEHEQNLDERNDPAVDHRSTSPSTTSSEPMSATTSATRCPLMSGGSACRLQNDGGRTRKRYGFVDFPSLTMK